MTEQVIWVPAESGTPAVHRPPYARLRVGDVCATVEQGGVIGRCRSAALRVRDKRISEGHAMLSFREEQLTLLGLRRKLIAPCGAIRRAVPLEVGRPVGLIPEIEIVAEELYIPEGVVQIAVDEAPLIPLGASVYSIVPDGEEIEVRPGYFGNAAAFLIWREAGWTSMSAAGEVRQLCTGDRLLVGEHVVRVLQTNFGAVAAVEHSNTELADKSFPMRVIVRYDTVHLHRADRPSLVISGVAARIVGELVRFAVPVPWEMVARELWTDGRDSARLRKNWDRHLGLLRKRLREARFPDDLVRPDGCGNVEIFLGKDDQLVDQT